MPEFGMIQKDVAQSMGNLIHQMHGDQVYTQSGSIVTISNGDADKAFAEVSVAVPYTSAGLTSVVLTRCGKNLWSINVPTTSFQATVFPINARGTFTISAAGENITQSTPSAAFLLWIFDGGVRYISWNNLANETGNRRYTGYLSQINLLNWGGVSGTMTEAQLELGSTATEYEPYKGDTYTFTLPATVYGGTLNATAGTFTSTYAADGSLLPEPVVYDVDPITVPMLDGTNNIWSDAGDISVTWYGDSAKYYPAQWYKEMYQAWQAGKYLLRSASGSIASFDDGEALPLAGVRVTIPYSETAAESVEISVSDGAATADTYTVTGLPSYFHGGELRLTEGEGKAMYDEYGNTLDKPVYFTFPPVTIDALAGTNNIWCDVDGSRVDVWYRVTQWGRC